MIFVIPPEEIDGRGCGLGLISCAEASVKASFGPLKILRASCKYWAVAGAECNTVIELKLEHHAA